MKNPNSIDQPAAFRVAAVISPHELPAAGIHPRSSTPKLDGRALIFSLPRVFIEDFAVEGLIFSQFAVYTAKDGRENFAIISVHRVGSLLHCVLPMSSPAVQFFLEDCVQRNSLQFVMTPEGETNFGVLRFKYGFSDLHLLRTLMHAARPVLDSDAGFSELDAITTEITAGFKNKSPWAGEFRTQVVAVLSELQRGLLSQQREPSDEHAAVRTPGCTVH